MHSYVPLIAVTILDVIVLLALSINYRSLGFGYLKYTAFSATAELFRHLLLLSAYDISPEYTAYALIAEAAFYCHLLSLFCLLVAVRLVCNSDFYKNILPWFLVAAASHTWALCFLSDNEVAFSWLSSGGLILAILLSLHVAFQSIKTRGGGIFWLFVFLVLLLILELLLVGASIQDSSGILGDLSILQAMVLNVNQCIFVATAFYQLSQKYRDSVTEQTRTAEDLKFVLNNIEDALISFDDDSIVRTWNQRASQLFGFSSDEVVQNRSVFDLVNETELEPIIAGLKELSPRESSSYRGELNVVDKYGRSIPTEVSVRRTELEDDSITTVLARDLSHLKSVELEKEVLAKRLEQIDRLESLGVMAGGIAHDFNNLLASISGYAGIVKEELAGYAGASTSLQLDQILVAVRRGNELTDQMLTYAGSGKYTQTTFELNETVNEIVTLMETVIAPKAVLSMSLNQEDLVLEADSSQVCQVVMNLVTNASDALNGNPGEIKVKTGEKELTKAQLYSRHFGDDLKAGRYVFVTVQDNGEGISPETERKMFDPFYSTKFVGRGLGMATVAGIVRRHRGAIELSSQLHHGSSFTVFFPAKERQVVDMSIKPIRTQLEDVIEGNVLVVEDESAVRILTKRILERAGCKVDTSDDGLAGLKRFKEIQDEVDLVLIDCTLPHMSGIELYQEIVQLKPDMRVIFCSGYNEANVVPNMSSLSHCKFLHKPYKRQELTGAVSDLLNA